MRKKAEILRKLHDIESEINGLDGTSTKEGLTVMQYYEHLGRIKALNWVLNKD